MRTAGLNNKTFERKKNKSGQSRLFALDLASIHAAVFLLEGEGRGGQVTPGYSHLAKHSGSCSRRCISLPETTNKTSRNRDQTQKRHQKRVLEAVNMINIESGCQKGEMPL